MTGFGKTGREKSMSRTITCWVALVALSLSTTAAHAATTFYSNRAAFLAAVNPATNIDFEGLAGAGSYAVLEGNTISGVTFTSDAGFLLAVDPAYAPSYYDWSSGAVASGYLYADPIHAALPGGKTAVGSDVMIADYYNGGVAEQMFATITLLDTTTATQSITTLAMPGQAFMGFTADQPIVSISFWTPDISGGEGPDYYPFPLLDNLVFSTVPEPASLALLAIGGCMLIRRRGMR
jgi:hypothetical protein